MNVGTWNMQGSSATTEVKWQQGVMALLGPDTVPRPSVVCLQECGAPPPSSTVVRNRKFRLPGGRGFGTVDLLSWGTARAACSVAFFNWDEGGNRVNLAVAVAPGIVVDDLALVWPDTGRVWRPAMGVQIGGELYFSLHAISSPGVDAKGLLQAVADNAGGANWWVGGDFNLEPTKVVAPAGSQVCPPDGDTYKRSALYTMYDFCVRSGGAAVTGKRASVDLSDHLAVTYQF